MLEADRRGKEFDPDGIGVRLPFGLGKGTYRKETDEHGYKEQGLSHSISIIYARKYIKYRAIIFGEEFVNLRP
jgi:hypothetical protein